MLRLRPVCVRTMLIVLLKNRWEEIHASQPHDRRDLRRRPHVLDGRIRAARGNGPGGSGLDKAVAAVKADQPVALAMFIKGEGGFLDRDLYPFCFRIADGKLLVSPKAVPAGTDIRSLKDANGNAYGPAISAAGEKPEGQITEVGPYLFPKPGTTTPTFPKVSFVTKVGELGCGVGYYN